MNTNQSIQDDPEFASIDGPDVKLPDFLLSMLRLGQILTKKVWVKRELTAAQISRLMQRHRSKVGVVYTGKEIRDNFEYHLCCFTGGGIRVEGDEYDRPLRGPGHYLFTFTRLDRSRSQAQRVNVAPEKAPDPITPITTETLTHDRPTT